MRKRFSWRVVKTVIGIGFRAHPRLMTGTVLIAIVAGVSGGLTPLGIKWFVDGAATADRGLLIRGAVTLTFGAAGTYAATTVSLLMSLKLIGYVHLYVNARIASLAGTTTGVEHFEHPEYLRELDLLAQNAFGLGWGPVNTVNVFRFMIQIGLGVGVLIAVDPPLAALVALAPIPLMLSRRATRAREDSDERLVERRRLLNELFQLAATAPSGRELRVYGLGPELIRRYEDTAAEVSAEVARTQRKALLFSATGWGIYALALVAAVFYATLRAADGALTIGAAVLTMQVGRQTVAQVGVIVSGVTQLFSMGRTARRLHWLEDYAAATRRGDAAASIPSALRSGIDLVGLSFRYPGTEPFVLRDVDLHFPAGSTVALVGVNGAGKTTLVKLLTAMYRPSDGRILVDGIDLSDFDPEEWRRHIAAGFQDFVRFELVAQQSVGVGDLGRADDVVAVETALTRAGAHAVIDQLSAGLRTPLGRSLADGQEISGGQWQQLALGRAMMRDAPLLVVLDEPTASLDSATEHALFERYAEAARRAGRANGAITILVSHRFSTVQMADVIVVIHDNGIAEIGSHSQLLELDGIYADLYRTQAAAYQ